MNGREGGWRLEASTFAVMVSASGAWEGRNGREFWNLPNLMTFYDKVSGEEADGWKMNLNFGAKKGNNYR